MNPAGRFLAASVGLGDEEGGDGAVLTGDGAAGRLTGGREAGREGASIGLEG